MDPEMIFCFAFQLRSCSHWGNQRNNPSSSWIELSRMPLLPPSSGKHVPPSHQDLYIMIRIRNAHVHCTNLQWWKLNTYLSSKVYMHFRECWEVHTFKLQLWNKSKHSNLSLSSSVMFVQLLDPAASTKCTSLYARENTCTCSEHNCQNTIGTTLHA